MRIIFFGTPEFAAKLISPIHQSESHEIVAVVTAPDKPSGRGQRLHPPAVKTSALAEGIEVLQPKNLKDKGFQNQLKAYRADVFMVVAFRMLPKAIWSMPKFGAINLHTSLLPQFRGAAPIQWALIRGTKYSGLTTFYIDDEIDTGKIIMQKRMKVMDEDTAGSLHDRMLEEAPSFLLNTLNEIQASDHVTTSQKEIQKYFKEELLPAPKLTKENTRMDWYSYSDEIYNFVRGLNPHPLAWTVLVNGEEEIPVKIHKVSPGKAMARKPGTILTNHKNTLSVACKDRWIDIEILQSPTKKAMKTSDWLNGFKLKEDAYFK